MSRAASTTSLPVSSSLGGVTNSTSLGQSFSKPPSLTKRRSSKNLGLTILTPANSKTSPQQGRAAVPPTPSFSRPNTLRHFQSSPSLPLHISEEIREEPSSETNQGQKEFTLPIMSRTQTLKTNDSDQNFDIPQSKEEKPEAYPDGPICVYGRYLDLYLEPTADQASKYDVILNVASEVKNPFDIASFQPSGPELRFDGGGGIQFAPKRSYLSASNTLGRENLSPVYESSPTTPKADPFLQRDINSAPQPEKSTKPQPEYIHIPWEHNTDIVPDLHRLVKVIDERIQQGKRVLIHCQCGVSRSATLVVAYVIYKNPVLSVQEAYDSVKKRSKWIGPNMNLIMQLQEFRSTLQRPMSRFGTTRGLTPNSPPLGFTEWGRPASYDGGVAGIKSPKTAPLPPDTGTQSQLLLSPVLASVGPGPSSAPSGSTWPSDHDEPAPPKPSETTRQEYVDPNGRVVPVVQVVEDHPILEPKVSKEPKDRPRSLNLESHIRQDSGRHITPMLSPRSTEFGMATLRPSKDIDSADQFGLMSPRATEFSQSPFDRDSLLGALGMGSAIPQPSKSRHLSPDVQKRSSEKRVPKSLALRPKISAPSLKEQQELQDIQTRLEAKLTHDEPDFLEALASPRAFEFTQNPFANPPEEISEAKPSTAGVKRDEDPRSPPHQGANPITRNIFDVL